MMWPFFKPTYTPDNSRKYCHVRDRQLADYGNTLIGKCTLCGSRIDLWPFRDNRCPGCLARVDHNFEHVEEAVGE